MAGALTPVKVHFPENTGRTYTYLAPESWSLQPGDHVRENSMIGRGYAIVVDTKASTVPSHVPLKVLDSFERPAPPRDHVVIVPQGTRVEVRAAGPHAARRIGSRFVGYVQA